MSHEEYFISDLVATALNKLKTIDNKESRYATVHQIMQKAYRKGREDGGKMVKNLAIETLKKI